MSRKAMIEFDKAELWPMIRRKCHSKESDVYEKISRVTGSTVPTIRSWFNAGRMPALAHQMIIAWTSSSKNDTKTEEAEPVQVSVEDISPDIFEEESRSAVDQFVDLTWELADKAPFEYMRIIKELIIFERTGGKNT